MLLKRLTLKYDKLAWAENSVFQTETNTAQYRKRICIFNLHAKFLG